MPDQPNVVIQYRSDLDMLTVRWLAGEEPNRERNDYDTILAEARKFPTVRWLIDVRRRPHPAPEVAAWAAQVWLPQVIEALAPGRPRLSYLISPDRAELLSANPALKASVAVATNPERAYDVAIFNDEGEATRWLLA